MSGGPERQLVVVLLLGRLCLNWVKYTWNGRSMEGGSALRCPATATSSLGAMCPRTGLVYGRATMEHVVV
jgi:hypothetical protein